MMFGWKANPHAGPFHIQSFIFGIYFLFLRPPLLPEDIRYMSFIPAELQSVGRSRR
jgi:hypothetical protein